MLRDIAITTEVHRDHNRGHVPNDGVEGGTMGRWAIRVTSLLLGLFIVLIQWQYIEFTQSQKPFGTDRGLVITVVDRSIPTATVISQLSSLARDDGALLVKRVPNTQDADRKLDLLYVGALPERPTGPFVDAKGTLTCADGRTGIIQPLNQLGTRPLEGDFAVTWTQKFEQDLNSLAPRLGLTVAWDKDPSVFALIRAYLTLNGLGNSILAAFSLVIAAVLSWQIGQARSRMYRLLGGVPQWRIHTRDTAQILALVAQGIIGGGVIATALVLFRSSPRFLGLEWPRLALILVIGIAVVVVVSMLMSLLARPAVTLIAQRRLPLPGYRKASTALTAFVVVLATLVVPFTTQSWVRTRALAEDYAQWQRLSNVVRISLSNVNRFDDPTANNRSRISWDLHKSRGSS